MSTFEFKITAFSNDNLIEITLITLKHNEDYINIFRSPQDLNNSRKSQNIDVLPKNTVYPKVYKNEYRHVNLSFIISCSDVKYHLIDLTE